MKTLSLLSSIVLFVIGILGSISFILFVIDGQGVSKWLPAMAVALFSLIFGCRGIFENCISRKAKDSGANH